MSNESFTVIRNRDNTVDYVFNESLMDELLKPFLVHMEEQMITILVITDEQTKWERKFTNCMKNFARRYCQYEFHLKNEIFAIDIVRDIQCRCGKKYNVIILDKPIDKRIEREILLPCLNERIITTNNYYDYAKGLESAKL